MAGAPSELGGGDSGRYRITSTLGEGGMGEVFMGVHIELGRDVAIKRLKNDAAMDESIVRRFFSEARAVNAIRHENIVEVTDLFTDDQGRAHMVMEYLEGCTLGDLIKAKAPLPPARVAHIGAQIAEALAAAHENGVIHRDIKPANVFLIKRKSTDDYVKLLDFGIAHLHPDIGGIEATESGQIVGTPVYMPPEQAKGDPVTASADIYSLGIMLYEMLSGDFPFPRSSAIQMMMAHIGDPPRPLDVPGLSPGFRELVERCLAKESEDRPPDAKTIATDLEQWAQRTKRSTATHRKERHETEETPPPPASGFDPTWDSTPKENKDSPGKGASNSPPPWIVIALVILVCGGVASALIITRESKTEEAPAIAASPAAALASDAGNESPRQALEERFLALKLPATPEACQSKDTNVIQAHDEVATLHLGGKPNVKRAQNRKARRILDALDDKLSPETLFWSARTHLFSGDMERAIKDSQEAYRYCKDFAAAYAVEGTAYAAQGAHKESIASLEKAVELSSEYTDARFNLAYSQIANGELTAAVASFSVVLSQDPTATDAHYMRGESYIALGKLDQARKDLEKAVVTWDDKGHPLSSSAWYALSHARRQTGDAAGARLAACKASDLGHAKAICPTADAPLTIQADEWVSDLFDAER